MYLSNKLSSLERFCGNVREEKYKNKICESFINDLVIISDGYQNKSGPLDRACLRQYSMVWPWNL